MAPTPEAGAPNDAPAPGPLDPRGETHIPIGIANSLDSLKTFVEAEGCFSPGFATYGIYVWLYDTAAGRLYAATMAGVRTDRGLDAGGGLIPWVSWSAGEVGVRLELCHVLRPSPAGPVHVVAARVSLRNGGGEARKVRLLAALRPLGAAGGPVRRLDVSEGGEALLVDGHPAIVAPDAPAASGVTATDAVGDHAARGEVPPDKHARSEAGDCSGCLAFDVDIAPGVEKTIAFICPVLPGRRAVPHKWDGRSGWAQLDLAEPNPPAGGVLQADAGLAYYRGLDADELFRQARAYWDELAGRLRVSLPDERWAQCLGAIVGHAALEMNEGAPDVAVVNYNVFNRDGVYVANILQKAGRLDLAAEAIDYFLRRPFNGRVQCEADNPGQVLWIMGQHWLFSRDDAWLRRVYPAAAKLAAMVRYLRTTDPPHYVKATSLEFGDALPPDEPDGPPADRRQVLRLGSCDGYHPEYTEAFDIAGLRAAALLAKAAGRADEAAAWADLAERLLRAYDERFGHDLARAYGSYSVLWPCRLYPLGEGKAREQFRRVAARGPDGWRYFPLAAAHQGLLAGNRQAGGGTVDRHLAHRQMHGWYAFDEGGRSGPGGWRSARTTWKPGVAMPHGWAIAEMWLLMRDCLLHEEGERLVLLAGVDAAWFTSPAGMRVEHAPTAFGGCCSLRYGVEGGRARLTIDDTAPPPGGYVLVVPAALEPAPRTAGVAAAAAEGGESRVFIPRGTTRVELDIRPGGAAQ